MIPQSFALAALAGAVAFLIAEGVQLGLVAKTAKEEGARVVLPAPLPVIELKPGQGLIDVRLPPDAETMLDNMHLVAAGVAVAVVVVTFLVVKG